MLPARPSLAAAAMLLAHTAHVSAWPHFLNARQTDGPAPWVTVDASGIASTVTPSVTTVSATSTTIINGAPADVTGTVATVPFWDTTSLITGTPSPPKPTGDVAGAFPLCSNRDGKDAPFCGPAAGSRLFPGSRYYFTWDAKYFHSNASVVVAGHYYNESTKEVGDEAFRSPKNVATRGFWTYPIDGSLLRDVLNPTETIILQIITEPRGSIARSSSRRQVTTDGNATTINGPIITVAKPSGPVAEQHFTVPTGAALYIGLPAAAGFILLCVLGVCLWNRKHRKIEIGNIMSRGRHGYGAGKSARSRLRMGKSRKFKEHIQLREREIDLQKSQQLQQGGVREQQSMSPGVPSPGFYRDVSPPLQSPGKMRRDRDEEDLGSLAGTPVDNKSMNFEHVGGEAGNVFRDEVRRQKGDKF